MRKTKNTTLPKLFKLYHVKLYLYLLIYYSDQLTTRPYGPIRHSKNSNIILQIETIFINKINTHDKMQLCFNITCVR